MDVEQLKAFIAVAKQGSFSLAAGELYVTQPAISKRIAALEAELETPLLDRVGRSLQLTQAGVTLLPRAEQILQDIARAKKSVADLAGGVRGDLRVATSHHLGLHKLPPVLRYFCARYPEVNLQIEFLDSEVALEKVSKGSCELAVITLPLESFDTLSLTPLWDDPLAFVTQPGSPLTTVKALSQLCGMPAILPDLNTYTGRLIKQCFDRRKLGLTLNMTTNYLETIKMMVSVGLGWSVLPRTMLDEQLGVIPIKDIQLGRQLGAVTHKKRHLGNAAQAFYATLTDNARTVITP